MLELIPRRKSLQPSRGTEEITDLLDRFFGETPAWGGEPALLPDIDVSQTRATIYVQAELPGMALEDIQVSLKGNLLTIEGQKNKETEDRGQSYYRSERLFGSFRRTVQLPTDVEEKGVCATYKNGVLKVTLPKSKAAQEAGRQVAVKQQQASS